MSSRTRLSFKVRVNKAGETIDITIADPSSFQADNLALATWGSADLLANVLCCIDVDLEGTGLRAGTMPVLELGAGTGLAGMTAAAVWHTAAVLTDLPPILPNIEANVQLNREILAKYDGSATCAMLDWAHPENMSFAGSQAPAASPASLDTGSAQHLGPTSVPARVILAADTVYSEEHPELVTNVIKHRLELTSASRLIMCYPLRVGYLDHIRDMWQKLEDAGLICIQEGREMVDESWDEDTPYEWCVWRWQDVDRCRQMHETLRKP